MNSNICFPHNKQVTHFGYKDKILVGMCEQCIETAFTSFKKADEIYKEIDGLKKFMVENVQKQLQSNIDLLNVLSNFLLLTSQQLKEVIEKHTQTILESIQNCVLEIQKQIERISKNINNYDSFDKNQLIEFFYQQNTVDFLKNKNTIQERFDDFEKQLSLSPVLEKLNQFPLIMHPIGFENKIDLFCQEHKQNIIKVSINKNENTINLLCQSCIQKNNNSQSESIEIIYQKFDQHKSNVIQLSLNYQKEVENAYRKIKENQTNLIISSVNKLKRQMIKLDCDQYHKKNKIVNSIQSLYKKQLNTTQDFVSFLRADQIEDDLQQKLAKLGQTVLQSESSNDILKTMNYVIQNFENCHQKYKQIENKYHLKQYLKIQQKNQCNVIAINSLKLVILVAQDNFIVVYKYDGKIFSKQQVLDDHQSRVVCLQFMLIQNQFVSGSWDKTIKIWYQHSNNQWQCKQTLKGHNQSVSCLTINLKNDLIISGSVDKQLRFWKKNKREDWYLSNNNFDLESQIYRIIMNDEETKLIVSLKNNFIYIFSGSKDEWKIMQTISTLSEVLFSIQQSAQNCIQLFLFNKQKQQFQQKQKLRVSQNNQKTDSCLFPQQFIQQKQLLISKNGQNVDILWLSENEELHHIGEIRFDDEVFGTVSEDGQYLITWDKKSEEIQIREWQDEKNNEL